MRLIEQRAEERVSAAEEEASLPPEIRVASHCSLTEDSSNTSNTSNSNTSTTVETEAAYKAVSEGELLSNVQLEDTMTGTIVIIISHAVCSAVILLLSLFSRGGSLHFLHLPAGHGEHHLSVSVPSPVIPDSIGTRTSMFLCVLPLHVVVFLTLKFR